jgi:hypothetical protein
MPQVLLLHGGLRYKGINKFVPEFDRCQGIKIAVMAFLPAIGNMNV